MCYSIFFSVLNGLIFFYYSQHLLCIIIICIRSTIWKRYADEVDSACNVITMVVSRNILLYVNIF